MASTELKVLVLLVEVEEKAERQLADWQLGLPTADWEAGLQACWMGAAGLQACWMGEAGLQAC